MSIVNIIVVVIIIIIIIVLFLTGSTVDFSAGTGMMKTQHIAWTCS